MALKKNFSKKNKGKQFKLYFITRAWKLMYFKNCYETNKQNADGKHHTHLNLDRDEFNNFSRFIHGMEVVDHYKKNLVALLSKKNLLTPELEKLIQRSKGIEELYTATKQKFGDWLSKQNTQKKKEHKLENYPNLAAPDTNIFYFNLSHFLKHLQAKNIIKINSGQLVFQANKHKGQLISAFYFRDKITKYDNLDKDERKLFNKLHRSRLEDCYLYEIAHRYLCEATGQERTDNIFVEVEKRYSQKLKLPIYKAADSQGNREFLYNIEISWKKLAQYVELVNFQNEQEIEPKNKGSSFLSNIPQYLLNGYYNFAGDAKNILPIAEKFRTAKIINYAELFSIYKNIMRQAFDLASVFFAIEEFAISISTTNNSFTWSELSYIDFDAYKKHISERSLQYSDIALVRKKVFHFGVPAKHYGTFLAKIEAAYIAKLLQSGAINDWKNIPDEEARLFALFLKVLHSDFFKGKGPKKEKKENARQRYIKEVIKKLSK